MKESGEEDATGKRVVMDTLSDLRWKTRTKVYENTVLVKFQLYCPKCKREILIDVVKLNTALSKEPDA